MAERELVDSVRPNERREFNARGAMVVRWFLDGDRYRYDAKLHARGWQQWDTDQDAWYFGVWVNASTREVFAYVEGDCIQVQSPDAASFAAELADMERVYGPPPPFAVVLDVDTGTRTECYGERLGPDDVDGVKRPS